MSLYTGVQRLLIYIRIYKIHVLRKINDTQCSFQANLEMDCQSFAIFTSIENRQKRLLLDGKEH